MPTLEERIADLQDQAGQLLDLPQQIADTAQQRINQIGSYWDARVQQMRTVAYVDTQAGDDSADGSVGHPLRSIDELLRRTPPGGVATAYLTSGLHIPAGGIDVDNRYLVVRSAGSVRQSISLERHTFEQANTTYRATGGFRLGARGRVAVIGCALQLPDLTGGWDAWPVHVAHAGLVQPSSSYAASGQSVHISYCDLVVPDAPYCALIGMFNAPIELYAAGLTITGTLEGNMFSQVSQPTATSGLSWLVTNLTTV